MDFDTYQKLIEQNKNHLDEGVSARFYDRAVKTGQLDNNGIPEFKDVCYCEIRIKDNTTEVFDQPATPEKIERFPVEYARYQLSKKQAKAGTPLENFAFLSLSEIESCKYHGIFTLEALASLSEERVRNLNLTKEQKTAQCFLENNRQVKNSEEIAQLKDVYEQKIASLKAELDDLKSKITTSVRRKKK
ncbi:MAG: hypothetical protein IKK52_02685 [Alphaproteobacteria bacterium]|nr:hypothetical protein [Alphaproteobacteria bacterium]